jgi:predicted MPP superfamily phosphohydrolase
VIKRVILVAGIVSATLVTTFGYKEATSDPQVRTITFDAPDWPSGKAPVRLLLMSDPHVEAPETPPPRLARIVRQANSLQPDIVVIAGDFMGASPIATKRYTVEQSVAPLRQLRTPLGVFAVLGNHDRSRGEEIVHALRSVGVKVLDDDVAQAGPIGLVGLRPGYYEARRRQRSLHGTKIMVAHSPDEFAKIRKKGRLMLAGHTHCGQIVFPLIGAPATGSEYGKRYLCGLVQEDGKTLIVTAGLGTSTIPIRIGAPPDMWLITIK